MACCCSHEESPRMIIDDAEKSEALYSSASDNEINILYHSSTHDEQENFQDNCTGNDGDDTCGDLIFVDGNNDDVAACEYEDTLMERVWLTSEPPAIPKNACDIPARRIQIMKERLSPTVKELSEALRDQGIKKAVNTRQKIESDVDYVRINDLKDEKRVSCHRRTVTIVPECAIKLGDLF